MIIDDSVCDLATLESDVFRKLIFDARITLFILMQDSIGFKPSFRANVHNVFLFADTGTQNIKRLWRLYGGVFTKLESFKEVFQKCTQNYETMVIKVTQTMSPKIEDSIFWYRVQEPLQIQAL